MAEGYVRARQREEYGGINWGAAFFGWLVAVGLGALLMAFLSAAGTAIAISEIDEATGSTAETVGIVGGILILAVTLIAYFAGGYVAGRMSRFDGSRQGLGVWLWSVIIAVVLAVIGAIAGSEYNLFAGLDLPRIPIDEGTLTTGGVIVLLVVLIGTLLAAMGGGKAGERYHRKVDAVGTDAHEHRREAEREDRARDSREDRARDSREGRGPVDRMRTRTAR
jgi:MFS family permease